ncbi:MAG: peptidase S41, partial [Bacteroidaceae bacterium]|nr:peptidase S41 [Bacteroidaceae bacterium]
MKQFFFKIGILCFASAIVFCGCQKDDDLNPPSGTGDNTDNANSNLIINNWIDGIMREKYLWYNDIPDRNRLNYGNTPTQFFKSLLSEQERGEKAGYYSTIEKNTTSARSINSVTLSYGMEYTLYRLPNTQYYVARILYVLPNSPATEAGIKRGDWIIASNGTPITADNYNQLLSSGTQAVLSTMIYNETTDEFIEGDNIQIAAARSVENNPIFLDTVYSHGTEKIGYLVYNNFITGKNVYNDKGYITEMVKCFESFKDQKVNLFILDLRYNGGGYIDCSQ